MLTAPKLTVAELRECIIEWQDVLNCTCNATEQEFQDALPEWVTETKAEAIQRIQSYIDKLQQEINNHDCTDSNCLRY